MVASVRFRKEAIEDIDRYEAWRERQEHSWQPINDALVRAIVSALSRYDAFDEIPARLLSVRGERAQVKRVLVRVRSKVFRVYIGPGRVGGVIAVRRIRHPAQPPLEQ